MEEKLIILRLSMRDKMEIINIILSLPIILIFYKDGIHKINNMYGFYLIVSDFRISKNKIFNKFLTAILISFDLTIMLGLLINSTRSISCILGVVLEIFYLITMLKNYEQGFKNGCDCYIINATKEVELVDILKVIGIIFIFSCILII